MTRKRGEVPEEHRDDDSANDYGRADDLHAAPPFLGFRASRNSSPSRNSARRFVRSTAALSFALTHSDPGTKTVVFTLDSASLFLIPSLYGNAAGRRRAQASSRLPRLRPAQEARLDPLRRQVRSARLGILLRVLLVNASRCRAIALATFGGITIRVNAVLSHHPQENRVPALPLPDGLHDEYLLAANPERRNMLDRLGFVFTMSGRS